MPLNFNMYMYFNYTPADPFDDKGWLQCWENMLSVCKFLKIYVK